MNKLNRASGVLMHITSLWGDYSCGTFGDAAKEFVDFLSDCGFTYWQVLPFCPVDDYNSPYKSYSTFAGNPFMLDLCILFDKNLLTHAELEQARQTTPYSCEFERLRSERYSLLKKAAEREKGVWIIRYPRGKESITGYVYEPWHIRYVGEDVAKEIFESEICLEEYLGIS